MKTTVTASKGEDLRAICLTATSIEVARDPSPARPEVRR
jgi:hypothetical protein